MRFTTQFLAALVAVVMAAAPAGDAAARRGGSAVSRETSPPHGPVNANVSVCFVPAQECDLAVVAAIRAARQTIRVQAYGFTSPTILQALAEARAGNVDVQAILDKSNLEGAGRTHASGAAFTADANIPTWIDTNVAIAHNKLIIIDSRLVIGGSYNYTASAERRNAENVTFIESFDVADMYLANWESRKAVSQPVRIGWARNSALTGAQPD